MGYVLRLPIKVRVLEGTTIEPFCVVRVGSTGNQRAEKMVAPRDRGTMWAAVEKLQTIATSWGLVWKDVALPVMDTEDTEGSSPDAGAPLNDTSDAAIQKYVSECCPEFVGLFTHQVLSAAPLANNASTIWQLVKDQSRSVPRARARAVQCVTMAMMD